MTNKELSAIAEKHIGDGYWWGCYGQTATEQLHDRKAKQYPIVYNTDFYSDWRDQLGRQVWDCVGLIKGILWGFDDPGAGEYGDGFPDYSADQVYKYAAEKGPIDTIPEIPGLFVWKTGHIGIYIGNGEVVEAQGHKNGVVKTKLKDRDFTHWGKIPKVEYIEECEEDNMKTFTEEQAKEIITDGNAALGRETLIPAWAADLYMDAVQDGVSDGTRPKAYATRIEVMCMIENAIKKFIKEEEDE